MNHLDSKQNTWLSLDRLLWVDGLAALMVGIFVFLLRDFLSGLLELPVRLLTLQSGITLCYAFYSLSLARQKQRPAWMIRTLAYGNWAYALFVIVLLVWYYPSCSAFGVVYFLAEILFMGGLGWLEFKYWKGNLLGGRSGKA